ncbi:MAG TPA: hypothetical protein DCQ98_20920 [Planctomycetaceae bacterium]|nr:hypothetical protein [Planctomycetaceae bacterium]HRF00668.1 hypothetical protein [Pirellulaceae bacterium]
MSRWLHHLWLTRFSKPKGERILFRTIKERPVRSVLEIGVGDLTRAERLIRFAGSFLPNGELRYTVVDLFEGRPDPSTGVSLKEAHGRLKQLDAKIKVIPGDPFSALARSANSLPETDLVLIAGDVDRDSLARAWTYLPRTLHQKSRILLATETADGDAYRLMTDAEIAAAAGANVKHIARAA